MPFKIIRNDLAEVKADAIVNTANHLPVAGGGVDSRLHHKAGSDLLEARKKLGTIPYGEAAITPAFGLKADYVIHTVSPLWDESEKAEQLLENCYRNSLALAKEKHCKSVAFPLIGAGTMGFPESLALETAMRVIGSFLLTEEMDILLVVFNKKAFTLSENLFSSVKAFIDENYVKETLSREYSVCSAAPEMRHEEEARLFNYSLDKTCASPRSLDDLMDQMDETFSESLLRLIDQKEMAYPEVYKRANVDRKLFSKIKNNPDYQPKKTTAAAFAIALKLNLDETRDLLGKAGYALTHSSKFDIIIEYFITEKNYNIFEINEVLFAFDQNLLF